MSRVRCKVKCIGTGEALWGSEKTHTAEFSAVYDADPNSENGRFFKATPSLTLKTGVIQHQHFEVGKEYFLDFTPVEEPAVV